MGSEFPLNGLRKLTGTRVAVGDWQGYYRHVNAIEEAYCNKDGIVSDIGRIIISAEKNMLRMETNRMR